MVGGFWRTRFSTCDQFVKTKIISGVPKRQSITWTHWFHETISGTQWFHKLRQYLENIDFKPKRRISNEEICCKMEVAATLFHIEYRERWRGMMDYLFVVVWNGMWRQFWRKKKKMWTVVTPWREGRNWGSRRKSDGDHWKSNDGLSPKRGFGKTWRM